MRVNTSVLCLKSLKSCLVASQAADDSQVQDPCNSHSLLLGISRLHGSGTGCPNRKYANAVGTDGAADALAHDVRIGLAVRQRRFLNGTEQRIVGTEQAAVTSRRHSLQAAWTTCRHVCTIMS